MVRRYARWPLLGLLIAAFVAVLATGAVAAVNWGPDAPTLNPGARFPVLDEKAEQELLRQDLEFVSGRTAGDIPLDVRRAGELRSAGLRHGRALDHTRPPVGPTTFSGAWSQIGPAPIGEITRSTQSLVPMNGRIGALAIRPSNGQIILGGAQGGIWSFDDATGTWSPKTNDKETQAIGALAVAPSDDAVIYAGTGEGALSGDSYFGSGILRSTDGGNTWTKVSGDYFEGVSTSRIVVDPTNARHLYAAILRGRGGARRVTVTPHTRYGIWESTDGGASWRLRREVPEQNGATDLEMDPQNPQILYASFWSDGIYKSINGGRTWARIMNFGLPSPDFSDVSVRFSLSISHPASGGSGVLYAGFPWADANGEHPSRVWKSTDGG